MNCIIPGLNLKVCAKALQALVKVGDDLFIEAQKEKMTLTALNLRKTVCVRCHLLDSFFSNYEVEENDHNETVTYKIHMKVVLPLFKGTHLEKKFDYVKIEYKSNSDVIYFKMKYKCDDIVMNHKLRLMDPETLSVDISSDSGCNNILTTSSVYNQLLSTFSNTDDEITMEFSKEKVVVRNYIVGAPVRPKCVRSQVNLNASEFNVFQINKETAINFSMKPFRTAIQFAEGFNLNIYLNFEVGGRPLAIVMKNPSFEVNFIVATLNPYNDVQSSLATTSIPAKITQHHNDNLNITAEDQEALQNENWDDFEMDLDQNNKKTTNSKKNNFEKISVKEKQNKPNKGNIGNDNKMLKPQDPSVRYVNREIEEVPHSPESPKTKKARLIFGRCFEATFTNSNLGEVLAPNSDSE